MTPPHPTGPHPPLQATARHPRGLVLRRFAGHARHLDPAAATVRVAHLTDLHVGLVTPIDVQRRAVAMTNAARPDLVVLTGDHVCFGLRFLDALEDIVAGFHAPVAAVLGNHDHWSGAREVRAALERAGALVLQNEWTTLTLRDRRLRLVGVDDAYTGHADAAGATRGLDRACASLGLSHVGEVAPALWRQGVPLVLSGHTHGGQVALAGLHHLVVGGLLGHRYVHGLHGSRREGPPTGAVYVGAGIGTSRWPIRLGARGRREVAVFELGLPPGSVPEDHAEQAPLPGRPPTPRAAARRASAVTRRRRRRERRARLRRRRAELVARWARRR